MCDETKATRVPPSNFQNESSGKAGKVDPNMADNPTNKVAGEASNSTKASDHYRRKLNNRLEIAEDALFFRLTRIRELRNDARFSTELAAELALKFLNDLDWII